MKERRDQRHRRGHRNHTLSTPSKDNDQDSRPSGRNRYRKISTIRPKRDASPSLLLLTSKCTPSSDPRRGTNQKKPQKKKKPSVVCRPQNHRGTPFSSASDTTIPTTNKTSSLSWREKVVVRVTIWLGRGGDGGSSQPPKERCFDLPWSCVAARESEMRDLAQRHEIPWKGSWLYETVVASLSPNKDDSRHVEVVLDDLCSDEEWCSSDYDTAIDSCLVPYYHTGQMQVPNTIRGPELVRLWERLGLMLLLPDDDDHDNYDRVRQWAIYWSHRVALVEWVRRGVSTHNNTTYFVATDDPHHIYYTRQSGHVCRVPPWSECATVHQLFHPHNNDDHDNEGIDVQLRKDFCRQVQRTLNQDQAQSNTTAVASFGIKQVVVQSQKPPTATATNPSNTSTTARLAVLCVRWKRKTGNNDHTQCHKSPQKIITKSSTYNPIEPNDNATISTSSTSTGSTGAICRSTYNVDQVEQDECSDSSSTASGSTTESDCDSHTSITTMSSSDDSVTSIGLSTRNRTMDCTTFSFCSSTPRTSSIHESDSKQSTDPPSLDSVSSASTTSEEDSPTVLEEQDPVEKEDLVIHDFLSTQKVSDGVIKDDDDRHDVVVDTNTNTKVDNVTHDHCHSTTTINMCSPPLHHVLTCNQNTTTTTSSQQLNDEDLDSVNDSSRWFWKIYRNVSYWGNLCCTNVFSFMTPSSTHDTRRRRTTTKNNSPRTASTNVYYQRRQRSPLYNDSCSSKNASAIRRRRLHFPADGRPPLSPSSSLASDNSLLLSSRAPRSLMFRHSR